MKTKITIIKETEKAALVQDAAGREAWMQKRWIKDGAVDEQIFSRNAEEKQAFDTEKKHGSIK